MFVQKNIIKSITYDVIESSFSKNAWSMWLHVAFRSLPLTAGSPVNLEVEDVATGVWYGNLGVQNDI